MSDLFAEQIPDNLTHYLIGKDTKGKASADTCCLVCAAGIQLHSL